MNRRDFGKALLGSAVASRLVVPAPALAQDRRWSFRATVAECCSCAIPCPCNFGRPTDRPCHGNRLIQLREGEFEGVDLSGTSFVVTFLMGQWTRLYIDQNLPQAKATALDGLLPAAFAGFHRLARTIERVPLTVQQGSGTFAFSVPESTVEMKLVPGLDGGPIRISGLPSPAFFDYVQYESVVHSHRSADAEWSHSGTNGFISEMRLHG